jgi:Tol biopolymer transport system component
MRSALILIVLTLISGPIILRVQPVHAAFPGTDSRIAFTSYRGWWSPPCTTTAAPWSPDPQKLAPDWTCDAGVVTVNPDGTDLREVFSGSGLLTPEWSPDGGKIALSANYTDTKTKGTGPIYVFGTDGLQWASGLTQLTFGQDSHPTWSPDGQKIAFDRWDPSIDSTSRWVYEMNADGTGITKVSRGENPSWSPDGRKVAFDLVSGGSAQIAVMNLDGSGLVTLAYGAMPGWSPDSQRIVFSSNRDGSWQIYTINADGSGMIKLSSKGDNEFPSWSPSGDRIVFTSDRDGVLLLGEGKPPRLTWNIYVINADGSNEYRLIDGAHFQGGQAANFFPTWRRMAVATTSSIATTSVMTGTSVVNSGNPAPTISFITLTVISSAIAFPVLTVSIVAARTRRRTTYGPLQRTTSWASIAAITVGGMLLVASLWQLEIVDIAASLNREWCPPFVIGGCVDWFIARDIWYTGVVLAFVLALIGAWKYVGNIQKQQASTQVTYARGDMEPHICPNCGFANPPFASSYCVKCGGPL